MAHTRTFAGLVRAARLAIESRRRGVPVLEYTEERFESWRLSRRRFLELSAAVPAAAGLASACGDDGGGGDGGGGGAEGGGGGGTDVVVVGGGIAGLTCAYRLVQAGVGVKVYDANDRAGGRMWSGRGLFRDDQVCEIGGELIDTGHEAIRNLAAELGIEMDDLLADTAGLEAERYFLGGALVDPATVLEEFRALAGRIEAAQADYESGDPAKVQALDRLSIPEWLEQNGAGAHVKAVLELAYDGEYGLPPDESSCLNLITLVMTGGESFHVFGDSDERFHTRGGNDLIPAALAERLGARVELGHRLVRIAEAAAGGYELTFEKAGGGSAAVSAGHVVLALPFTQLRKVDVRVEMPDDKRAVVRELRYGNCAKLMVGFDARVWRTLGHDGQSLADLPAYTLSWEASRGQAGASGIIVDYLSTSRADRLPQGTEQERAAEFAAEFDRVFPGVQAAHNGLAKRQHWPSVPWVEGAYAAYGVGDWSRFGQEQERVGNLHFCGEHCSGDWQGFMNGGCETGESAAAEVLADLGKAETAAHALRLRGRRSLLAPFGLSALRRPRRRRPARRS